MLDPLEGRNCFFFLWRSTKQTGMGMSHVKSVARRVLQHLLPSMICCCSLCIKPFFLPNISRHPVPVLILHPRELKILW